ncbi:MAG: hypothetical protein M1275_01260 [Patescibacteria group bacterium]|nr:hypothetical protein [Patescibacteria group bacterium]
MDTIGPIVNLIFHLFMGFVILMSGTALFALLRFGQSRLVGVLTAIFYIALVSSLYSQALLIINQI